MPLASLFSRRFGKRTISIPIRRKLILSIGLPMLVIYLAVLAVDYARTRQRALATRQDQMMELAGHHAANFNAQFAAAAQIAQTTAELLSLRAQTPQQELFAIVRANVAHNPGVYGSAIAFAPSAYDPARRLFAPYAHRQGDTIQVMDIGHDGYNYAAGGWEWYTLPSQTLRPAWTEPYEDKGAGNILMSTCAAPLLRQGKFWGVATVDVRLNDLQRFIGESELAGGSFMILSRNGGFISHPPGIGESGGTIFDLAARINRPDLAELGRRMLSGQPGFYRLPGLNRPEPTWVFYAPIPSTGWSFSASIPEAQIMAPVYEQLSLGIKIMTAGLILIIGILLIAAVRISTPVEKLAAAVNRLAAGNLDVQVDIRQWDEIGDLARAFNKMVLDLKRNIKALTEEHAARKSVENELRTAREIQTSLLPQTFPPFPNRKEFGLHAANLPAKHVAGDFYDFFFINEETLVLVIADVSGKGVPAALFMAVTRTVVRNLANSGYPPAEILRRANEILRDGNTRPMFVTIWVGHYNTRTGQLQYANAAHPLAYRIEPDGQLRHFGRPTGTILGVLGGQTYTQRTARVGIGERLVFYTDGIPEARDPEGKFLSDAGAAELFARHAGEPIDQFCRSVMEEVARFQNDNLKDDVTLVVLQRNGCN